MNYDRIYDYRFRNVSQNKRDAVWKIITPFIEKKLGQPDVILDPAAGRGEFLSHCVSNEKWAVEWSSEIKHAFDKAIHVVNGDVLSVDLPENHFDGIFVSNFLEHLANPEAIASFLERMFIIAKNGAKFVIMGPNYRLLVKKYFDFADHIMPITEKSAAEQLYGAGFKIIEIEPSFLPYSFHSKLPLSPIFMYLYVKFKPLWWLFGKQFLIVAEKP